MPLLLLAYAPREGLGGAHVVLGLLAHSLYSSPVQPCELALRCWSLELHATANHS